MDIFRRTIFNCVPLTLQKTIWSNLYHRSMFQIHWRKLLPIDVCMTEKNSSKSGTTKFVYLYTTMMSPQSTIHKKVSTFCWPAIVFKIKLGKITRRPKQPLYCIRHTWTSNVYSFIYMEVSRIVYTYRIGQYILYITWYTHHNI